MTDPRQGEAAREASKQAPKQASNQSSIQSSTQAASGRTADGPKARVGWIGAGIMGSSMVRHLLRAGHAVTVHSRTKARCAALLDEGAAWADSPALAACGADFVCTNVGLPAELEEVMFGNRGVAGALSSGQIVIDFGTSPPSLARRIAEAAGAVGAESLDAPVSGGDIGARNGTLSIMVGGAETAFEHARPLFEAFGKTVVHQGGAGAGQRTKIVNQVLVAASTLGMCEALHLAVRAGLDPQQVLASVGGGAAASWSISVLAPRVLSGDFAPGFLVEHLVKDLRIAEEEAAELGLDLPAVRLARGRYEALLAAGGGRLGTQGLYLLYANPSAVSGK
ncbi:MAG: NAD-binding protein [Phycisphaera sp.]|nr:NAD-binding protein [Phycisphaera sp.]